MAFILEIIITFQCVQVVKDGLNTVLALVFESAAWCGSKVLHSFSLVVILSLGGLLTTTFEIRKKDYDIIAGFKEMFGSTYSPWR